MTTYYLKNLNKLRYQTSGFLFGKVIAKLADNYENQIFYKEVN